MPFLNVRGKVLANSKLKTNYTDKFAGKFVSMANINNFLAQQKLYPSGDISSNGFVDQDVKSVDIYTKV